MSKPTFAGMRRQILCALELAAERAGSWERFGLLVNNAKAVSFGALYDAVYRRTRLGKLFVVDQIRALNQRSNI